ncbi:restriction endonuclease subunit S [Pseudomonas mediterranea]|uniref:restriction endonuclease subunit S n=1 Tax=Pseudomonas mediterranea TaxID=183795 RepID=UPI000B0CDB38|nr:restriction endonuclease subunit S [Pseudomonas mediterranea]
MTLPPYPVYKQSGIDWLGAVPENWDSKRLKFLFNLVKREIREEDRIVTCFRDGTVTLRENRRTDGFTNALKEIGYQGIRTGDLVIHAMDAFAGAIGISDSDGKSSPVYSVCTPVSPIVSAGYYARLLRNMAVAGFVSSLAKGIRERSTDFRWADASEIFLPVPPEQEQRIIVNFLDHETARIDELIKEQQRLIELLKEKRQAVISHAITKGLDSTVPMKDSDVEWLGKVPAHWKVSKLGRYAQILTGFPFPSASFSHDESDVRLLRGANIGVGSLKWIDTVYWPLSESDSLSSYLMEEGQIVLGMDRPWINEGMRIARVTQEDLPCLLLQRVAAITPNADLDDEYLYCLLASELFKAYVEPDLTGVSVPHISPEQILSFQIPLPEIVEQRRISSFIRKQLDQMSALFEQASKSIELLQEHRSALISAAVTGKIDVRGWQPPTSVHAPVLLEAEAV